MKVLFMLALFCLFASRPSFSEVVIKDSSTGKEVAWDDIKDQFPDIVLIDGVFYHLKDKSDMTVDDSQALRTDTHR